MSDLPTPPQILSDDDLDALNHGARLVEAVLFASPEPVNQDLLSGRLPEGVPIEEVLAKLAEIYQNRGVTLVRIGKTWAFRTAPDLAAELKTEVAVKRKLSRAAVETLAIIAYHQPVTRAEIEEIRGVALSKGTLDLLLEAGWIRPRGRRKVAGRPLTWGTTPDFLDHFGLAEITDLPGMDDLKAAGLLDRRPGLTTISMGEEEAEDDEPEEQLSMLGDPLVSDDGTVQPDLEQRESGTD